MITSGVNRNRRNQTSMQTLGRDDDTSAQLAPSRRSADATVPPDVIGLATSIYRNARMSPRSGTPGLLHPVHDHRFYVNSALEENAALVWMRNQANSG